MEKTLKITSIIAGAAIVISLITVYAFMSINSAENINIIDIQGMSSLKVVPDLTVVYISVESNASTSVDAKANADAVLDRFLTEMIVCAILIQLRILVNKCYGVNLT